MVNLESLSDALTSADIGRDSANRICEAAATSLQQFNHGDLSRWMAALDELSRVVAQLKHPESDSAFLRSISTDTVSVDIQNTIPAGAATDLLNSLKQLRPWRKGPYRIGGIHIDTEWRSDWKWQRLEPHISRLNGKRVLDVGCGNGYHGWRMRGAGASLVLGIDPSALFLVQFCALQQFMSERAFQMLPMKMEALPEHLAAFDSVFSMGVLYHRRDHQAHLQELQGAMRPGAELILETLIIPGEGKQLITPATMEPGADGSLKPVTHGRYARMRNVWALPSADLLVDWVAEAGFMDIRIVDVNQTSLDEQRTTDWMPFESLAEALDPSRPGYTIEGWPAPSRALLIAKRT